MAFKYTAPIRRVILLTALLALAGCAHHYSGSEASDPYGFLSGIWHGVVFPLSLMANVLSWLCSLVGVSFLDSIEIIGRPNTGFFYYFGFVLGFMGTGGGAKAA